MLSRIAQGLDEIEGFLPYTKARSVAVSGWSVGQQIEHSLLTIRGVVSELVKSGSNPQPAKPTILGRVVLAVGWIPRGRGNAPIPVLPNSAPAVDELNVLLRRCRESIQRLIQVDEGSTMMHPVFGRLDKKSSIRFLSVHTRHHIRIIRDILSADG